MTPEFSVVPGAIVHRLIQSHFRDCVETVRKAYLAHGAHDSVNPPSHFLRFPHHPNDRIIALPAQLGGEFNVSGIKWIASYPDNIKRGLPRASAVLILNDMQSGYPFALLESSIISAARTAASAVLAANHLGRHGKTARKLGFIGTGLIARYIYHFFLEEGWRADEVMLYDLVPAEAKRFQSEVIQAGRHQRASIASSSEALTAACDLIVFATVAAEPHLWDGALLNHNPLILHISLRDLGPELIVKAQNIVDDVDHVLKANTSVHLVQQKLGHHRFIDGTLPEVLRGDVTPRTDQPIIFSPFGLGVLDLAVGWWVFEQAKAQGLLAPIQGFFHELSR